MTAPRVINSLLFPKRIAIAGLSPREDSWGQIAYSNLREGGFAGEILAYRPRHPGLRVPTIVSFEENDPVDLLLVALPAQAAVDAIRSAAAGGVGSAIVFSSGFAEVPEGIELQRQLVEAAAGMPLLGPNCLGVVSTPGSLVASVSGFLSRPRSAGPVALISQSGAMGYVLADRLARRGLGFSYYASTGNEAVLGAADLVAAVAGMPEVRVIGCYLEGIRDVDAWRQACRKATAAGCRIVALKVGTSAAGRRAALSHTAAATGEAELFRAVGREEGVVLVHDEVEFAQTASALAHPVDLPPRPGLAVITMSGGAGVMIADQTAHCASMPELTEATRAKARALGVSLASDTNPIDLSGMFFHHLDSLGDLIEAVAGDPSVDAIALYFTFGDQYADTYRNLIGQLDDLPVPTWFVWAGAGQGEVERQAGKANVVGSIPELVNSLVANRRAGEVLTSKDLRQRRSRTVSPPLPAAAVLSEAQIAPILSSIGLAYVPLVVGRNRREVLNRLRAARLPSPWVVKVDDPRAPHRARLGLVRLGIRTHKELTETVADLFKAAVDAGLTGASVVVEPMIPATGMLSLGAIRHPGYGDVIVLGPGGGRVEDPNERRVAACLPLSPTGVAALCQGARELTGQQVDADLLADAATALEILLRDAPWVREVDVNPVLVTPGGALVAVDSLAVGS